MDLEHVDGGSDPEENPEILAQALADILPSFNEDLYQKDRALAVDIARAYYRFLSAEDKLRVRRRYGELRRRQ